MTLLLTVLEVVAPVFLLASLGFGWVRLGYDYPVEFVTRLAMTLAVPCLIFTALMRTEIAPATLGTMTLASLLGYGLIGLVAFLGLVATGLDRRTFFAPLTFGNTGNVGLPLALFAFGETGLGFAVVTFAVSSILIFTVGIWSVAGKGTGWRVLREPMVLATLLGALFLSQGWTTPRVLTNALTLLGQMAIPLMLITLGVAVARLSPGSLGRAVGLSAAKVVVCVAVAAGTGHMLGLPEVAQGVLVLQLATPVAVTSYLLAQKYGADASAVAGFVVVSSLMSVAVFPAILAVLL